MDSGEGDVKTIDPPAPVPEAEPVASPATIDDVDEVKKTITAKEDETEEEVGEATDQLQPPPEDSPNAEQPETEPDDEETTERNSVGGGTKEEGVVSAAEPTEG